MYGPFKISLKLDAAVGVGRADGDDGHVGVGRADGDDVAVGTTSSQTLALLFFPWPSPSNHGVLVRLGRDLVRASPRIFHQRPGSSGPASRWTGCVTSPRLSHARF